MVCKMLSNIEQQDVKCYSAFLNRVDTSPPKSLENCWELTGQLNQRFQIAGWHAVSEINRKWSSKILSTQVHWRFEDSEWIR